MIFIRVWGIPTDQRHTCMDRIVAGLERMVATFDEPWKHSRLRVFFPDGEYSYGKEILVEASHTDSRVLTSITSRARAALLEVLPSGTIVHCQGHLIAPDHSFFSA